MSEKTYVFDSGANSAAQMLPALLQNRGIDPAYFAGMMNNGGMGNFGINEIIALVVIAALFGGNNGNGIFGGGNNRNAESEMILQTLNRNGVDISQLAQALNCSTGQIQNGINTLGTQICNLSGQVGMSGQQIINSIQAGNAQLSSQLCNCCCEIRQAISESNYLTERGFCNTNQILSRGFADLGYATRDQTCNIEKAINNSTQQILAGQAAIEKRELQREIATLQEEKQTYKLGNMIAAATNPILAEVESIKCKLPRTEPVNVSPDYIPVNRSVNVAYAPYCGCGFGGFNGFGFGNWNNPNGSLWG